MNVMVWLALLVILLIVEAATASLTTIWFAGGALMGALAAYLGAGLVPQLLIFSGVSVVLLLFTRPLAVKNLKTRPQKTNMDALPGKRVLVTQTIDNLNQTGQIRLNDVEWSARSETEKTVIQEGALVEILSVQGVKVIVREVKEENV